MSLSHVPVDHTPCQDSCGGRSSPTAVWSPVSVLPSGGSAAVSCTLPVDLASRLLACCAPDAVGRSGFEDGWWQTCHLPHGGGVASKDKRKEFTSVKRLNN